MSDVRVTSCSAILSKKISVCENRCHTLIFKDKDIWKTVVCSENKGLSNCYLGFFKVRKLFEIWIFFQHFLSLQKKSPQIKKKIGIHVLEVSKECM